MKLIWELYDYCKGKGLLSEELSRQVEECLDLEFSVQLVGTGDDWESDSWHEDAVFTPGATTTGRLGQSRMRSLPSRPPANCRRSPARPVEAGSGARQASPSKAASPGSP